MIEAAFIIRPNRARAAMLASLLLAPGLFPLTASAQDDQAAKPPAKAAPFPSNLSGAVLQSYQEYLAAPRSYSETIAAAGGAGATGATGTTGASGFGATAQPATVIIGGGAGSTGASATRTAATATASRVILFDNGSSDLSEESVANINRMATQALQNNARIYVYGHASSRTVEMPIESHLLINLRISAARADAVAAALVQAGVPFARITIVAKGDNAPRYNESMPSGEAGNRRVEIFF